MGTLLISKVREEFSGINVSSGFIGSGLGFRVEVLRLGAEGRLKVEGLRPQSRHLMLLKEGCRSGGSFAKSGKKMFASFCKVLAPNPCTLSKAQCDWDSRARV